MFNSFCYYLNVIKLSFVPALLRRGLHLLLAPVASEGEYADPQAVGGWRGWIEAPRVGVLAFRREAGGQFVYRW